MGDVARLTAWGQAEQVLQALGAPASLAREELLRPGRHSSSGVLGETVELRRKDLRPAAFPYQLELAEEVADRVGEGRRGLLSLPTGAGKTRTAVLALLRRLAQDSDSRWLWMAPSIELVEQAARTFIELWTQDAGAPDVSLAVRSRHPDARVWFNTPQAMQRQDLGEQAFDVIVFDEAHQLGAPTFRRAVDSWSHAGTSVIGLSATPGRSDDRETRFLVDYFDQSLLRSSELGRNPVLALQDRGVLARLGFRGIGTRDPDLDETDRIRRLAKLCRHLDSRGRRVMVFTATVAEAIGISVYLRSVGVAADYVEGSLPEGERRARISDFADGRVGVLLNQRLLATGYDCPAVTDVVLGTRIGSAILFEQMVGRAARGPLTGGANLARVWEFDDHLSIHGLPQSYYRYRDFEWR